MVGKKTFMISLVVVLLFLFSMVSSAQITEDFTTFSQFSNVDACVCSTLEDTITLSNTGSFVSGFTISVEGNGKDYYVLSDTFMILKPGETRQIKNFIELPCDSASLDVNIVVETNTGIKKIIPQHIDVINCNNNKFEFLFGNSFSNEPCSITRYDLELTNIGLRTEVYSLDVEEISGGYISFSENPVMLLPSDKAHVVALITMPCEKYGNYEGSFTSTAEKSGMKAKLPFYLDIDRKFNYSLGFGEYVKEGDSFTPTFDRVKPYSFCEGVTSAIPVQLHNEVFVSNTYLLDESSKETWVSLEDETISVHGFEKKIFNIIINPDYGNEGNYTIPLSVQSLRGDMGLDLEIPFEVEDCMSFTVNLREYDKTCCGINVYTLNITNTGTMANEFSLELRDNKTSLPEYTVTIEAGETAELPLTVFEPCNGTLESMIVEVRVGISDFIAKEVSLNIDFVDKETCNLLTINKKSEVFFNEYKEKKLELTNNGIKASNYVLEFLGADWINLSEYEVFIEPGKSHTIFMKANPWNASNEDYTITMKAHSDNNYTYEHIIDVTLKEKTAYDKVLEFLEAYKSLVILLILIIVVLILLIPFMLGKKSKKEKKKVKEVTPVKVKEKKVKVEKKSVKKVKKTKRKGKRFKAVWLIFLAIIIILIFASIWSYNYLNQPTPENETEEIVEVEETVEEDKVSIWEKIASWFTKPINEEDVENETVEVVENETVEEDNVSIWEKIASWFTKPINEEETPENETVEVVENETVEIEGNETVEAVENETVEVEETVEEDKVSIWEKIASWFTKPINEEGENETEEDVEVPYEEQLYAYIVENNLTDSFQYHFWNKDMVYTIDLNAFFIDPDSDDKLEFTSTNPEHIDVEMNNGIVSLTPEKGWVGVDYIAFKAIDSNDAQVLTPEITLIIRDNDGINIPFSKNKIAYVIFIIAIIIIITLLLTSGDKKKK